MLHGIEAFEEVRKKSALPWICDDVFFDFIVPLCAKESCKKCNRWVGDRHGTFACYMPTYTLCFNCRHKVIWPRI